MHTYKPIQLAKTFLEPLNDLLKPRKDYLLGCFGSFANHEAGRVWLPGQKAYLYLSDMDLLLILPQDFRLNQNWLVLFSENFRCKWRIPDIARWVIIKDTPMPIDPYVRVYLKSATKVLYGNPELLKGFEIKEPGPYGLKEIIDLFYLSTKNLLTAAILRKLIKRWNDAPLWFGWNIAKIFHFCGMAFVRKHTCVNYATIKARSAYLQKKGYFGLPYFGPYYRRNIKFKLKPRRLGYIPECRNEEFIKLVVLFTKWWDIILKEYWESSDTQDKKTAAKEKIRFKTTLGHLEDLITVSVAGKKNDYVDWTNVTLKQYLPEQKLLLFMPREVLRLCIAPQQLKKT